MSITYNSLISQLANLTVITSNTLVNGDTNFPTGIIGGAIDYAEGRLYRDLDLPAARVGSTSLATCSSGSPNVIINASLTGLFNEFLVLEQVGVYSPATSPTSTATLIPLVPTSGAVISTLYPTATSVGAPEFYARLTNTFLQIGPTPDQAYPVFVYGTFRPPALSVAISSTWLTQNLPELMVAGCMVFMSGYMRDATQGPYWESQYQILMKSANVDSLRMKYQSVAWSEQIPSPLATRV